MARAQRKPIPQPEQTAANDVGPGHNSLTSDQRLCLALSYRRRKKALDAEKARVSADLKNWGRAVKADLGDNGAIQVKDMIARESPEGAEKLDAEMRARTEARVWVSDDRQLDMFPVAPKLTDTEAFMKGKIAGMDDEPCKSPYAPETADSEDFIRGWQAGRKVMDDLNAERAEHAELVKGGDLDDEDGAE